MAPWSVTWPFGESNSDLPDSIPPSKGGSDSAFEVFVDGALTKIYNEANGRGKDNRAIREACKSVLDGLRGEAEAKKAITSPLDANTTAEVFKALQLAVGSSNAKLADPVLGCLHKLISHAYLHAESTPAGRLTDGSTVSQVIAMVAKCGEQSGEATQLSVLRALLTIGTAEHFVAHGDCLMQIVRTAFNVAVAADSEEIKRTAKNALLQMLNTIVKRVTQYPLSRMASMASAGSLNFDRIATGGMPAESLQEAIPEAPDEGIDGDGKVEAGSEAAMGVTSGQAASAISPSSGGADSSTQQIRESGGQQGREETGTTENSSQNGAVQESTIEWSAKNAEMAQPSSQAQPDQEEASGRQMAQRDPADSSSNPFEAGTSEAASLALLQPAEVLPGPEPTTRNALPDSQDNGVTLGGTRTAQLATLAEQADIRGIERALDQIEAERGERVETALGGGQPVLPRSDSARREEVRRSVMREKRLLAWKHLTLNERDVLTVLSAVCKMAARDTGFGAAEDMLHDGKMLALDLLYHVLENPLHSWNNVRPEFCEQLRQYLWPALLRNSLSPYREAFQAVTRLLTTILMQPKLRGGLKVEINAFYPLMLLRPLEADKPDQTQQLAALEALKAICSNAQLMADLFVNYDCNLQSSNLFERSLKGVARVIQAAPAPPSQPYAMATATPPPADSIRDTAVATLLLLLKTLDERAQPLKDSAAANAQADSEHLGHPNSWKPNSGDPQTGLPSRISEVARFGALKEKKHSLEAGIALFNGDAVKGMDSLIASGTVENESTAIAMFLRSNAGLLDATQVGEYFGHHEDQAIEVMHAYIDQERYVGLTIDAALRELLKGFRLPGEAQKIDRIMEKFADRYCRDNEGAFSSADGPYLLAFALIMLNTDAHNPRAEKKLSCEDFVTMCQSQDGSGAFEPILPRDELEAMYHRILAQEIPLPSSATVGDPQAGSSQRRGIQASRLAAALGLSHLFRKQRWDKQQGLAMERAYLLKHTRDLVSRGQQAEHMWHTANHVEHVTAMLQIVGDSVRRALVAALHSAYDAGFAAPVLGGFLLVIRLAGMLGLDQLTDSLVASLAAATGVEHPSAEGSTAEAKELAALAALISLASNREAGFLGSGWVTILRTLSSLDLLKEKLIHGGQKGNFFSVAPGQVEPTFTGNPQPYFLTRPLQPPAKTRSFGKGLLQRLGLASESSQALSESSKVMHEGSSAAQEGSRVGIVAASNDLFHGPSAVLVNWSENEGREAIERVYSCSSSLSGDGVVVFVRALCAVSQEELAPASADQPARIYSLSRVMECAYHNLGRIRLIWARLWGAVAPHLVSAACHSDPHVAALAVSHMRQLIADLLARAELSHFTYQEDALRPLVSVMKHSGSAAVREQVVSLIAHSITTHPKGLGSGWRSVLQLLAVAAADSKQSVLEAALNATEAVIAALYQGIGVDTDALFKTCFILETAIRNSHHEELSTTAAGMVQAVAHRLSQSPDKDSQEAWQQLLAVVTLVARHDPRQAVGDAAAEALSGTIQLYGPHWQADIWEAALRNGIAYLLDFPPPNSTPDTPVVGWSVEGKVRVCRHAQKHVPGILQTISHSLESAATIFQPVLEILVKPILQRDSGVAELGVLLLKEAILMCGPHMSQGLWSSIVQALNQACSPEIRAPMFRSTGANSQPNGLSGAGGQEALAAEVRCLTRTAFLTQQMLCTILDHCASMMPASTQLQLLSILQDSVARANSFNHHVKRRLEITHLLQGPTLQALAPTEPAERLQNGHAGVEDSDEESDDEGVEVAEVRDSAAAALIRQEAEGGALLSAALHRCMTSNGPGEEAEKASQEAQSRLLSLNRQIIATAASHSRPAGGRSGQSSFSVNIEAFAWDQAIRAPLTATVLIGYKDVSREAWKSELPIIWPHLAQLIFSPQPGVRQALASLLAVQCSPLLNGL